MKRTVIALLLLIALMMALPLAPSGRGDTTQPSFTLTHTQTPKSLWFPFDWIGTDYVVVKNTAPTPQWIGFTAAESDPTGRITNFPLSYHVYTPFPQLNFMYLQPNESQMINYHTIDSSLLENNPQLTDGNYSVQFKLSVYSVTFPLPPRPDMSKATNMTITYPFRLTSTANLSRVSTTMVYGRIYDRETGLPVQLQSQQGPNYPLDSGTLVVREGLLLKWAPGNNGTGFYQIPLYRYGSYSFTLDFKGYESFHSILQMSSTSTQPIRMDVPLSRASETGNYTSFKTYNATYPPFAASWSLSKGVFLVPNTPGYPVSDSSQYLRLMGFNGSLLMNVKTNGTWGVAISDDAKLMADGSLDQPYLQVFDNSGHQLWERQLTGLLGLTSSWAVRFTHDDVYLAAGTQTGDLYLFNAQNGAQVWHDNVSLGTIRGITVGANDTYIYAQSGDGWLYKVSVATGQVQDRVYTETFSFPQAYAMTPDQQVYVTVSKLGNLTYVNQWKDLWTADMAGGGEAVALSDNGQHVLAASGTWTRLYDSSGNALWTLEGSMKFGVFTPDQKHVAIAGSGDTGIYDLQGTPIWATYSAAEGSFILMSSDQGTIVTADETGVFTFFHGRITQLATPVNYAAQATVNGGQATVSVRSDANISGISASGTGIGFHAVTNPTIAPFFNVTLPKSAFSGPLQVSVDGEPVTSTTYQDSNNYRVVALLSPGAHDVSISLAVTTTTNSTSTTTTSTSGTSTSSTSTTTTPVPEFPGLGLVFTFLVAMAAVGAVLVRMRGTGSLRR